MHYPVCKTKQEFEKDWYIADHFGSNRGSYIHNGADINLKTGGNTDMGKPLYAVTDAKLVYYHKNSHPTRNYGRHLVYYVKTSFGDRWVHYAHMQEQDFLSGVQDLKEGQIIGRIGNSGTGYAHLHMSVFKVDPATLSSGIDTIATTQTILNKYWEDPLVFLDQLSQGDTMGDTALDECLRLHGQLVDETVKLKDQLAECQAQKSKMSDEFKKAEEDYKAKIAKAEEEAYQQKQAFKEHKAWEASALNTTQDVADIRSEIVRLVTIEDQKEKVVRERDYLKHLNDSAESKIVSLQSEISKLKEELRLAKGLNDATTVQLLQELIKRLQNIVRRS